LNFTWFGLGHPRLAWAPAAQSADLIGGYGLALAPFLTNLMLAKIWAARTELTKTFAVCVIGIGVADASYCAWRWSQVETGNSIAVGIVQSERYELSIFKELTDGLLQAAPDTQLVVWPELAFSAKPGDKERLQEFVRRRQVTLVTGVEIPMPDGYRNRAWWLPSDGETAEYAKQTRVPFVERHPASEECTTFELPTPHGPVQVGVLICYDIDFARPARRLVNECGAEIIALPTLDDVSWGGTQHVQHALLPRLRAIENRRPIVQAATSGVSQILDHRGCPVTTIPFRLNTRPDRPTMYGEGFAAGRVAPRQTISFYGQFGYWIPQMGTGLALALIIWVTVFAGRTGRG
jgi:apolipoprotein N-acyltransferase